LLLRTELEISRARQQPVRRKNLLDLLDEVDTGFGGLRFSGGDHCESKFAGEDIRSHLIMAGRVAPRAPKGSIFQESEPFQSIGRRARSDAPYRGIYEIGSKVQSHFCHCSRQVSRALFTTTSTAALFFAIVFAGRMPRQFTFG